MSLHLSAIEPVPDMTRRVARAAFPKGNLSLRRRDEFGTFVTEELFADLFPKRAQPAEAPWRLALITLFQFVENLSDQQAAEALRARMDWKYALSLELEDPGFDASVLCEFRARLGEGTAQTRLFETRLAAFTRAEALQRTGATTHPQHPCHGCRPCPQSPRNRR